LAKLLHDHRSGQLLPPPGTTVILDEAAMAATDDLDQLVALVDRHRWRLVAVGDPEQLPAVGRGGMFAHWCDTLPAHHLDHVYRFDQPWEAPASLALRRGDPDAAATYAAHRRVRTSHPALIARSVANRHRTLTAGGATVAITTSTAATARAINLEIQRDHHLGQPPGPAIALADGTQVRPGDRIATRRNHPDLVTDHGIAVRNRHTWDVTAIEPTGVVVAHHPQRGTIRLPRHYVTDHVELGWAVTGYGTQGDTVDHGICIIEPGATRAGIYVGLTRGRATNHAVIADPTGIADPHDALATAIARPPNATTAIATRARLHQAHGHPDPDLTEQAPSHRGPGTHDPDPRPAPTGPGPTGPGPPGLGLLPPPPPRATPTTPTTDPHPRPMTTRSRCARPHARPGARYGPVCPDPPPSRHQGRSCSRVLQAASVPEPLGDALAVRVTATPSSGDGSVDARKVKRIGAQSLHLVRGQFHDDDVHIMST
jgi:hypothetical protein